MMSFALIELEFNDFDVALQIEEEGKTSLSSFLLEREREKKSLLCLEIIRSLETIKSVYLKRKATSEAFLFRNERISNGNSTFFLSLSLSLVLYQHSIVSVFTSRLKINCVTRKKKK